MNFEDSILAFDGTPIRPTNDLLAIIRQIPGQSWLSEYEKEVSYPTLIEIAEEWLTGRLINAVFRDGRLVRTAPARAIKVVGMAPETLERYLPNNYVVVEFRQMSGEWHCICHGADVAGWTFEDYVKPRIQSSMSAKVSEVITAHV